mmetsp:Transcript_13377/g.31379  ORF Transcript_13377/g.31379 Transcript_13377/m.31379 type:complete len:1203 (-) Transcript_13377:91-3699(-)
MPGEALDVSLLQATVKNIERLIDRFNGEEDHNDQDSEEGETTAHFPAGVDQAGPSPAAVEEDKEGDAAAVKANAAGPQKPSVVLRSQSVVGMRKRPSKDDSDESSSEASSSSGSDFLEFGEGDLLGSVDFELQTTYEHVNDLMEKLRTSDRVEVAEKMNVWFREAVTQMRWHDEELNDTEELGLRVEYETDHAALELKALCESQCGDIIQVMRGFHEKMQEFGNLFPKRNPIQTAGNNRLGSILVSGPPDVQSVAQDFEKIFGSDAQADGEVAGPEEQEKQRVIRKMPPAAKLQAAKVEVSSIASELLDVIAKQQHEIAHLHTKADLSRRKEELLRSALDYTVAEKEYNAAAEESSKPRRHGFNGPQISVAATELLNHMQDEIRMKVTNDLLTSPEGREFLRELLPNEASAEMEDAIEIAALQEESSQLQQQKDRLEEQVRKIGDPKHREDALRRQVFEYQDALKQMSLASAHSRAIDQQDSHAGRGKKTAKSLGALQKSASAFKGKSKKKGAANAKAKRLGSKAEQEDTKSAAQNQTIGLEAAQAQDAAEEGSSSEGDSDGDAPDDSTAEAARQVPSQLHEALSNLCESVESEVRVLQQKKAQFLEAFNDAITRCAEDAYWKEQKSNDAEAAQDPDQQMRELVREKREVLEKSRRRNEAIQEQVHEVQRQLTAARATQKESEAFAAARTREGVRQEARERARSSVMEKSSSPSRHGNESSAESAGEPNSPNLSPKSNGPGSVADGEALPHAESEGFSFKETDAPASSKQAKTQLRQVNSDIRVLESQRASLEKSIAELRPVKEGVAPSPPALEPSSVTAPNQAEEGVALESPPELLSRASSGTVLSSRGGSGAASPLAEQASRSRLASDIDSAASAAWNATDAAGADDGMERQASHETAASSSFQRSIAASETHNSAASDLLEVPTDPRANSATSDGGKVGTADASASGSSGGNRKARGKCEPVLSMSVLSSKYDKASLARREERVLELLQLYQEGAHLKFKMVDLGHRVKAAKAAAASGTAAEKIAPAKPEVPEANLQKRKEVAQKQKQLNALRQQWQSAKEKDRLSSSGDVAEAAAEGNGDAEVQEPEAEKRTWPPNQVEALTLLLLQDAAANRLNVSKPAAAGGGARRDSSTRTAAGGAGVPTQSPTAAVASRWLSAFQAVKSNAPEGGIAQAGPGARFLSVVGALMQRRKSNIGSPT